MIDIISTNTCSVHHHCRKREWSPRQELQNSRAKWNFLLNWENLQDKREKGEHFYTEIETQNYITLLGLGAEESL